MNGEPPPEVDATDGIVSDIPDFRPQTTSLQTKFRGRESIRTLLAYLILILIAGLSGTIVWATIEHWIDIDVAKDLALALVAPLFSIFAAIIGFYYGNEAK